MVPSIFGENMLDDFFDGGFFGKAHFLIDFYKKICYNIYRKKIKNNSLVQEKSK